MFMRQVVVGLLCSVVIVGCFDEPESTGEGLYRVDGALETELEVAAVDPQLLAAGWFAETPMAVATDEHGATTEVEATLEVLAGDEGRIRVVTEAPATHLQLTPLRPVEIHDGGVAFDPPVGLDNTWLVAAVWVDVDADGNLDVNVGEDSELVRTISRERDGHTFYLSGYEYDPVEDAAAAWATAIYGDTRAEMRVRSDDTAGWRATIPGAAEVAP